jgi:hypothetical protein
MSPYTGPERRTSQEADAGPTLQQYVETRFDLIDKSIQAQLKSQEYSILSLVDSAKVASITLKEALLASQAAADVRYQQRFEAQSDALEAAFQSQQQAMQTAFTTAEKAVQAALAAADRAVTKAEMAADKRFETVTNLMTDKVESITRVVDALQGRLDLSTGEVQGGRLKRDDTKSVISLGVAVIAVLMALWSFFNKPAADPALAAILSDLKAQHASAPPAAAAPQVIYVPAPAGALLPQTAPQQGPR